MGGWRRRRLRFPRSTLPQRPLRGRTPHPHPSPARGEGL